MADKARPRKQPAPKKKPARAKRKSAGRPKHVPDENSNNLVRGLAMVGASHEAISEVLQAVTGQSVSPTTLRKHYPFELEFGKLRANANVAAALYNAAIKVARDPKYTQAAIFYAKTQIGWRERERMDDLVEAAIRDLDNAPISDEDKVAIRTEMDQLVHDLETTGRSRR